MTPIWVEKKWFKFIRLAFFIDELELWNIVEAMLVNVAAMMFESWASSLSE